MPRILITCPETKKPVYTGLNFDWFTFDAMEIEPTSMDCPECGQRHRWQKADAYPEADGGEG